MPGAGGGSSAGGGRLWWLPVGGGGGLGTVDLVAAVEVADSGAGCWA